MKFLEVLKKFDKAIVKENKVLKSAYAALLKEAAEEEEVKEAEETVEQKCCDEAEEEEKKVDEAEDKEVDEADDEEVDEAEKEARKYYTPSIEILIDNKSYTVRTYSIP